MEKRQLSLSGLPTALAQIFSSDRGTVSRRAGQPSRPAPRIPWRGVSCWEDVRSPHIVVMSVAVQTAPSPPDRETRFPKACGEGMRPCARGFGRRQDQGRSFPCRQRTAAAKAGRTAGPLLLTFGARRAAARHSEQSGQILRYGLPQIKKISVFCGQGLLMRDRRPLLGRKAGAGERPARRQEAAGPGEGRQDGVGSGDGGEGRAKDGKGRCRYPGIVMGSVRAASKNMCAAPEPRGHRCVPGRRTRVSFGMMQYGSGLRCRLQKLLSPRKVAGEGGERARAARQGRARCDAGSRGHRTQQSPGEGKTPVFGEVFPLPRGIRLGCSLLFSAGSIPASGH